MCRFRVSGRPIRRILHRFQNVPASCERSLRTDLTANFQFVKTLVNFVDLRELSPLEII